MRAQKLEEIYNDAIREYEGISRFNRLTSLTYDLALASVEKTESNKAFKIPKEISKSKMSYSAADKEVNEVELVRGWIPFDEYSDKTGTSIDEIQEKADKGDLGEVKEKDGKRVIFWPPEEQGNSDLPPVDSKNTYMVTVSVKGTVSYKKETDVEEMISYLGSVDALEKQTSEASLLLNRETFLLFWSAFEQYVKNITFALFDLFPEQVFNNKKYGKNQMSYSDIFEESSKFTNIQKLKDSIISSIVGEPGTEREAISKQIMFIQECYIGKNENPYDTWYVIGGERKEINFQVLDQIRIMRNALVHKTGEMTTEDWDKIDLINRPDDNRIVVDSNLLMKTEMILKSISYNIYRLISKS